MNIKEEQALLKLLEDPSPKVYSVIERKILELGFSFLPNLNNYLAETNSQFVKERIKFLANKITENFIIDNLIFIKNNNFKDLGSLSYTLSLINKPFLEEEFYFEKFIELKTFLLAEYNPSLSLLGKIKILNHILFSIKKFSAINLNTKSNHYFVETLFSIGKSSIESISLLALSLMNVIDLRLVPVQLNTTLLLGVQNEKAEVLYYLNPGYRGAIVTEKEIKNYLRNQNIKNFEDFYKPISVEIFITQLFSTIEIAYRRENNLVKADFMLKLKQLLK